MRQSVSIEQRFWQKVKVIADADSCWLWTGGKTGMGYGLIRIGGRGHGYVQAHRLSYQIANGTIGNFLVLHRCDTPACVRPKHLFLGTNADNTADMMAKGRNKPGLGRVKGSRNKA